MILTLLHVGHDKVKGTMMFDTLFEWNKTYTVKVKKVVLKK